MKWICLLCCLVALPLAASAGETPAIQNLVRIKLMLHEARVAYDHGQITNALALATRAIEMNPAAAESWMFRGRLRDATRDFAGAAGDFAKVIELQPRAVEAYILRGQARFCLGHVGSALADFDKVVDMAPVLGPQLWQRGVALFELGRYADARKQFESCHTASTNDVECAAWHFLCVAKTDGVDKARDNLLTVGGDPRVPMPEIYASLTGKGTADAVLAAAKAGDVPAAERDRRQFYAHFYLGLFYEATGDRAKAREQLAAAVTLADKVDFLGVAARLHAERLRAAEK